MGGTSIDIMNDLIQRSLLTGKMSLELKSMVAKVVVQHCLQRGKGANFILSLTL